MIYIYSLLAFGLASIIGLSLAKTSNRKKKSLLELKIEKIKASAQKKQNYIETELHENIEHFQFKTSQLELTITENATVLEEKIQLKTSTFDKKQKRITERENFKTNLETELSALSLSSAQAREQLEYALSHKAGITVSEAKEKILVDFDNELIPFFQQLAVKHIENCKDSATKEAVHQLTSVMQKYSQLSSVDRLEKTIQVKHDVLKGRLIGRGAKNLVYLEEKTGADIIFEDDKSTITVSCFNLVIQETTKIAITKLLHEKVINPETIDKALLAAKDELDKELIKIGNRAADIIGIENRDPELMKLIGRLKYRTSYGQNILFHSMEIAYFSALMAAEIGANIETAKLGGFFHDIGKAIDQEVEGSHDYLGKEILERFGYSWEVVHAAWTHHDAIPIETVEAQLVKAADAISAGRPGARTESAEMYIERIQGLEKIAMETKHVKKAFALSAGRELRTIVDEKQVKDEDMQAIADIMAQTIENELAYPGRVKVNLIRKIESTDIANKGASANNPTS